MATYEELYSLRNKSVLKNKVNTACILAAEAVMLEDGGTVNHQNRLLWAKAVFANPKGETERMFMAILAANAAADIAVILAAPDVTIQTNVDDHIDLFADGS